MNNMNKAIIASAITAALASPAMAGQFDNVVYPEGSFEQKVVQMEYYITSDINYLNHRVDHLEGNTVPRDEFDNFKTNASSVMQHLDGKTTDLWDRVGNLSSQMMRENDVRDIITQQTDPVFARVENVANSALEQANNASQMAGQALRENAEQDRQIAFLGDGLIETDGRIIDMDQRIDDTHNVAHRAESEAFRANDDNLLQDAQIVDLQANKADRSELDEVAIKADGALAGAIENRNQIDQLREDLVDTNQQVTTNKNDIANLKNQNSALNDAVTNAQNTANTASAKANNAQNTADRAMAGVNNVKNDVEVVSHNVANNSIRIQRNEERIDGAYAGIYDNRKNIEANRQAINRNSQEIQKLNKNFSDLKNTVDANRKRAAAGIAGVAAMANIPEVNSHQTFSLGVGVGGFDGQQAVAAGASARVNDNLTVKASVAANNEEVVWGAGAAIGW